VFVDVDPFTFNIDPEKIEEAITSNTKCIIPVHLYGQGADMASIMSIAERHNLYVIEDNAQSLGAQINLKGENRKLGSIGHISTTSFYPSKVLGAYGDAGAIFTNDEKLAKRLKMICDHGQSVKYKSEILGINSRMDSLQAVVLQVKLKYFPEALAARKLIAASYDKAFVDISELTIPTRVGYGDHVFHQYTLLCNNINRDEFKNALKEDGISSLIYYPIPLHLQPVFQNHGFKEGDFPNSERLSKQSLSLPIHTELDASKLDYIINSTRKNIKKL
ncbi:UNVERIFIED_CONTAM: hypothetical protein GTU68_036027, partial [Idotea baltica]|nr:hypothetical protein [Idotea baltica]